MFVDQSSLGLSNFLVKRDLSLLLGDKEAAQHKLTRKILKTKTQPKKKRQRSSSRGATRNHESENAKKGSSYNGSMVNESD